MMNWYHSLASRERQFVSLGFLFVVFAGLYVFAYEPLDKALNESRTKLALKQGAWSKMVRITDEYKTLGSTNKRPVSDDKRSLLSIIDKSGASVGIKSSIKRLTPEGDKKVRVRVEDVAFDQLMKWLVTNSTRNSIHAELFMARKENQNGKVNATILFAKE